MAKFIPGIKLSPAKIAQFDEYMRDVLENAKVCPGILTYLPQDLAAFKAASEALHEMFARPLRWELTPEIKDADTALDKALSALRYMMKASVENPDAEAAAAGKVVLRMSEIDKITGSEQYDEESGKISAMLTTLLGDYAEQTQKAGIMPYVMQLKERNERLCQLLQDRDLTQGEAGPHNTSELRQKTETIYRRMVFDVNSVSNCIDLGIIPVNGAKEGEENPFRTFIDYMIGHIDRFHREVLRTSSSRPGDTVEEEVTEEETETTTPDNGGGNGGGTTGGENNGNQGGDNGGNNGNYPPGYDPDADDDPGV